MTQQLSKQTISDIRAAVREELKDQHLKFWIEPEEHYRQHVALEGVLHAYDAACTVFARTFIGIAVIGVLTVTIFAVRFWRVS